MLTRNRLRLLLVLLAALTAIVVVVATGDDQKELLFDEHPGARGVAADRAFVELIVPEERVRMALAKRALVRADHDALRRFAARISRQTGSEIGDLLGLVPSIDADVPRGFGPPVAQASADSGAQGGSKDLHIPQTTVACSSAPIAPEPRTT
jgi:uncharacterized protein (DUF305 family)